MTLHSRPDGKHTGKPAKQPLCAGHKSDSQVKHLRTPLTSLNLQDCKSSGHASSASDRTHLDAT